MMSIVRKWHEQGRMEPRQFFLELLFRKFTRDEFHTLEPGKIEITGFDSEEGHENVCYGLHSRRGIW